MRKTRDTFKEIGDTKGGFQVQIDTIKERKHKDLTEAAVIKKRWQEYTGKLYRKDLYDLDNHNGMITH